MKQNIYRCISFLFSLIWVFIAGLIQTFNLLNRRWLIPALIGIALIELGIARKGKKRIIENRAARFTLSDSYKYVLYVLLVLIVASLWGIIHLTNFMVWLLIGTYMVYFLFLFAKELKRVSKINCE